MRARRTTESGASMWSQARPGTRVHVDVRRSLREPRARRVVDGVRALGDETWTSPPGWDGELAPEAVLVVALEERAQLRGIEPERVATAVGHEVHREPLRERQLRPFGDDRGDEVVALVPGLGARSRNREDVDDGVAGSSNATVRARTGIEDVRDRTKPASVSRGRPCRRSCGPAIAVTPCSVTTARTSSAAAATV